MTNKDEVILFRQAIKELVTVAMLLHPNDFQANETGNDDKSILHPVKAGYLATELIRGMDGHEARAMAIRNYTHASDRLRAFLDGSPVEQVV